GGRERQGALSVYRAQEQCAERRLFGRRAVRVLWGAVARTVPVGRDEWEDGPQLRGTTPGCHLRGNVAGQSLGPLGRLRGLARPLGPGGREGAPVGWPPGLVPGGGWLLCQRPGGVRRRDTDDPRVGPGRPAAASDRGPVRRPGAAGGLLTPGGPRPLRLRRWHPAPARPEQRQGDRLPARTSGRRHGGGVLARRPAGRKRRE